MAYSVAMEPRLSPQVLTNLYANGAFPMATDDGSIEVFIPERRAILPLDGFVVTRSLRNSSRRFESRFDTSYEAVMRGCMRPDTWISEEFVQAYVRMFELGMGSCSESWRDGRLVGGVYGVAFGRAFMAESMFHTETDAGKVALWRLVERLRAKGYTLCDVQFMTPHLASLGAVEVSHEEYMRLLAKALPASL